MRTGFLAQLCAALILASLFLPWFPDAVGGHFVPSRLIAQVDPAEYLQRLSQLPTEGMAFAASYGLAALFLLFGMMGAAPRLIALVTGALPLGIAGWAFWKSYETAKSLAIDGAAPDFGRLLRETTQLFEAGAWLWLGSGGVLFLLALIDRGGSSPPRRA